MFKRVLLAAGVMVGALFGFGGVSEAQAAGPHGHGHHGHRGHHGHGHHGHHGHGHHGHWSHGHGHWHGHVQFRPYYPRPYYVPYAAPVYGYPPPYYYNRGPSLFLGSGGLSVRVPF